MEKELKQAVKALKERLGIGAVRYGYYGIKAAHDREDLYISSLTGKLEGFHSCSTSPERSEFCNRMHACPGSICSVCFSRRSVIPEEGGYKHGLRDNLSHNYDWLNISRTVDQFPVLNDLYFRIESHGDVDTPIQAENFIHLYQRNPDTRFTAWTKNPIAWNEAFKALGKPTNLIMVYSSPMINIEVRYEDIVKVFPWVDKVFTVYSPEYIIDHPEIEGTINCGTRQCMSCLLCYRKDNDVRQIRELQK